MLLTRAGQLEAMYIISQAFPFLATHTDQAYMAVPSLAGVTQNQFTQMLWRRDPSHRNLQTPYYLHFWLFVKRYIKRKMSVFCNIPSQKQEKTSVVIGQKQKYAELLLWNKKVK